MADEIKVKMSEFANATNVGDSDEIIILQGGENKKVGTPILEQKIIDKVVPRVSDEVKEIYTDPTPLYLADSTPTNNGVYIPMEYGTYSNGLDYNNGDGDVEFILKSGVWTKRIIPFVANGEVKEGDLRAVSGGEVASVFVENVGIEINDANSIDLLEDYKNTDRTDTSSSSVWQSGYYNASGVLVGSTSWVCTRDLIPIKKGKYISSILCTSTAALCLYDSNGIFIESFLDKSGYATPSEWEFEMPEGGFFKFSYYIFLDTEPNYMPLESRTITNKEPFYESTSAVFLKTEDVPNKIKETLNEDYGVTNTPAGTNFIEELVNSDLTDTSLWNTGFLNSLGNRQGGERWYHTVKYYKIPKGTYEYSLRFSSSAVGLLYDINYNIVEVLSKGSDASVFSIATNEDLYLRFSHRRSTEDELTNTIYWENTKEITPDIITSKNISEYSSNDSYRDIIKSQFKPKKDKLIVSFISDDGALSEYDWFCDLMEEYGIRATLAIIPSRLNTPGYMTPEQVVELSNRGHEIASHTMTHKWLDELTPDERHYELAQSKLYLENLVDKKVNVFVSPFGVHGSAVDSEISAYYDCNFITNWNDPTNIPPIDTYFIKRLAFDLSTGETERFESVIKPFLEDAIINPSFVVFSLHTGRSSEYNARRQELRDLIEWLQSNEIPIVTAGVGYEFYKNYIDLGLKRVDPTYYKLGMDFTEENVGFFE